VDVKFEVEPNGSPIGCMIRFIATGDVDVQSTRGSRVRREWSDVPFNVKPGDRISLALAEGSLIPLARVVIWPVFSGGAPALTAAAC
jgi:hypothetical protein